MIQIQKKKDEKCFYHESIGKTRVNFNSILNDQYKIFSIAITPFTNDFDW